MQHRPLILHITGDYPDPSRPPTTVAIKSLIDSLDACDHVVVSLTRTANPNPFALQLQAHSAPANQRLFSMHHFGLPLGAGLLPAFGIVAARIEHLLAANGLRPDVVHSHRLTFDGIAGWLIARKRGIPHVVSIRGEVESKVLRFKPTYRPLIRHILNAAHKIYYVSAWFRPELERLAPGIAAKSRLLPNIVANTRSEILTMPPRPTIVAVANLDIFEKKGLDRLVAAFARAAPRMPGIALDIIGGGAAANVARMQALIDASGVSDRIRLRGAIANARFLDELPTALALALPSRNETFGMVYTEALFAGVPILYSRATGIDGHLDGLDVGIGVNADDIAAIAEALVVLVNDNARFRASIAAAAPELYRRFNREAQVAAYLADIVSAEPAGCHSGAVPARSRAHDVAPGEVGPCSRS